MRVVTSTINLHIESYKTGYIENQLLLRYECMKSVTDYICLQILIN